MDCSYMPIYICKTAVILVAAQLGAENALLTANAVNLEMGSKIAFALKRVRAFRTLKGRTLLGYARYLAGFPPPPLHEMARARAV